MYCHEMHVRSNWLQHCDIDYIHGYNYGLVFALTILVSLLCVLSTWHIKEQHSHLKVYAKVNRLIHDYHILGQTYNLCIVTLFYNEMQWIPYNDVLCVI